MQVKPVWRYCLLVCVGVFNCLPILANTLPEPLLVTRVQPPAWMERGGEIAPLQANTEIRLYDRIRTDRSGRVEVQIGNKRQLNIGGRSEVFFPSNQIQSSSGELIIRVTSGGFALYPLSNASKTNPVSIRLRNLAMHVQDPTTTVYGRASTNTDLGCVEDGFSEFSLLSNANSMIELSTGNCYSLPINKPNDPNIVSLDKLVEHSLASATMIQADQATQARDGQWQVEFLSGTGKQQLQSEGFAVKSLPSSTNTLVIAQLESEKHAIWMGDKLKNRFNANVSQIRQVKPTNSTVMMGAAPQARPAPAPPVASIARTNQAQQQPRAIPAPVPAPSAAVPNRVRAAPENVEPQVLWLVNIAAYKNDGVKRSLKIQSQLEAMGLQVLHRPVSIGDKSWIRVSVGPFSRREQANAWLPKLSSSFRSLQGLWVEQVNY